jgi:hypothetical protein
MNTDAIFEALNKLAITPGEGRLPKAFALLDLLDQLSFKSENFNVDKAYDFGHDLRSAKISFGILEGYVPPDSQEAFAGEENVDEGDGEAELESEGDYDPETDSELAEAAAPVDESEILLETLERMRALTEP